MSEPRLALRKVCKNWGRLAALRDIDLAVEPGKFVSLLGPSGCGKTTLLRLITGQLAADSGRLMVDGQDITDLPTHRRNMGMVFQSFALFPHLSVAGNVAFALKVRGVPAAESRARVEEALAMVHLATYRDAYPRELSGGQQQRVGLARAIVYRPAILLLDEPLSNLDASLREEMRIEISQITRRLGITSIYVTHDQREALALSDMIAVMNQGRIVQFGTPEDIYRRPASAFVAGFVGYTNAVPIMVAGGRATIGEGIGILRASALNGIAGAATAFLHASDVTLSEIGADAPNRLVCRVMERAFMGDHIEYVVEHEAGLQLRAHMPIGPSSFERGASVFAVLPDDKLVLVPQGAAPQDGA